MKKINLLTACVFALFVLNASAVGEAKPWYSGIVDGAAESPKDCTKETIKSAYTNFFLTPLIINPIKNFLYPAEKSQKDTAEIVTLSEQIKKLRDAGVSRKYIAALQAQLKKKIEDSTKNDDPKK